MVVVASEETIELESGEINRISCRLEQGRRSQFHSGSSLPNTPSSGVDRPFWQKNKI